MILQAAALADDDDDRFYVSAGPGLVFFNPPDKDSFPFYETDNLLAVGVSGRIVSPLDFDPDDIAVSGNFALGYRLGNPQPNGIWGSNFRAEFSTNFYFPEYSKTKSLEPPRDDFGFQAVTVGVFYSDDGIEGLSPLAGTVVAASLAEAPNVKFSVDYDYIDFNLGVRNDYTLVKDVVTVSPSLGLTVAWLQQEYNYSTRTAPGLAFLLDIYDYEANEDLDSWYVGVNMGMDFNFQVTEGLSFSLGGFIAPLYVHTDMDLKFDGSIVTNPIAAPAATPMTTHVNDTDSAWTYRTGATAEVKYRINWFEVSLSGRMDYWENVPIVVYPEYNTNDWSLFPVVNLSDNDVPKIGDDDMLNFGSLLKFTFYF